MIEEEKLERDQMVALAVARLIATERSGGAVTIVSIPERDDRTNPAVELFTEDAVGTLAIEHTLIEPFPGQIRGSYQLQPYSEALPPMVADRLPAGSRFDLNLDVGVTGGIKPTPEALCAIATWIVETAPTLEVGGPGADGRHLAKSGPPSLPFPATLVRWPKSLSEAIPIMNIGRWKPDDLEKRRQERLVTALEKKLPKLAAAKAEGHEGVLVLESNDIQLSNHFDIAVALRVAAAACEMPLPSWIVLWEQFDGDAFVSLPRVSGTWVDDLVSVKIAGVELGTNPAGGR